MFCIHGSILKFLGTTSQQIQNESTAKSYNSKGMKYYSLPKEDRKFLKNNKREIINFFEDPSISKMVWLFMSYGGWWVFVAFVIFSLIFVKITLVLIEMKDFATKNQEFYNHPHEERTFSDLNLWNNFFDFLKSVFSFRMRELSDLQKEQNNNLLIQFLLLIVAIGILTIASILLTNIILATSFKKFRVNIFSEFVDKVRIEHFSNPQQCIKFLNTLFNNVELLINSFLTVTYYVFAFLAFFAICLTKTYRVNDDSKDEIHYSKWKICLWTWFGLQLLSTIVLFVFNVKKSQTALNITILENGIIAAIDENKIFGLLKNSEQEYIDLVNQMGNEKIFKEIFNFTVILITGILSAFVLGWGLNFDVYKIGGVLGVLWALQEMFNNYAKVPDKSAQILKICHTLKESFAKFKCINECGPYIVIKRKIVEKKLAKTITDNHEPPGVWNKFKWKFSIDQCFEFLLNKYPARKIYFYKNEFFITKDMLTTIKKISFQNVTFKYPNSEKIVIENANFTIHKDEKVGKLILVIGPSGRGKTSIFSLILKLYKATSGTILINDIPIEFIDSQSMYDQIIAAVQFPYIRREACDKSIKSVINTQIKNLGEKKNQQEHIVENDGTDTPYLNFLVKRAVSNSGLGELITDPSQVVINDGGKNLSGGMRQMLVLARILLSMSYTTSLNLKKLLIFLDEIVSSLDAKRAQETITKILDVIEQTKALAFAIDHSGHFLKIIQDPKIKKNIDVGILFLGPNGPVYGTIADLSEDPDFRYFIQTQAKNLNQN